MPRANDCIGPYQLIGRLGKGAFGEVWLAKNAVAIVYEVVRPDPRLVGAGA